MERHIRELGAIAAGALLLAGLALSGTLPRLTSDSSLTAATALGDQQGVPPSYTGYAYPDQTVCYVNANPEYGCGAVSCSDICVHSAGTPQTGGANPGGVTAGSYWFYSGIFSAGSATAGLSDYVISTYSPAYTNYQYAGQYQCTYYSDSGWYTTDCQGVDSDRPFCPAGEVSGFQGCYTTYGVPASFSSYHSYAGSQPSVPSGGSLTLAWSCLPSRWVSQELKSEQSWYSEGRWGFSLYYSLTVATASIGSGQGFSTGGALYGSKTIAAPTTPGTYTYSVQCIGGSYALPAMSVSVTVIALLIPQTTILTTDASTYAPGATITAHWVDSRAPDANDWVALAPAGGDWWNGSTGGQGTGWQWVYGVQTGSAALKAPGTGGLYDAIYYTYDASVNSWKALARKTVTIGTPPTLAIAATGASPDCAGTWSILASGQYGGTFTIPAGSGSTFTGPIQFSGSNPEQLSGSCANGSISFDRLGTGQHYTGTYGNGAMSGTFTASGSTYSWVASQTTYNAVVGQPITITGTYTPGAGDSFTATTLTGPNTTDNQLAAPGSPYSPKSYVYTPSGTGDFVFYPSVKTAGFPSWNNWSKSVTVHVTAAVPTVTTNPASGITSSGATLNALGNPNGTAATGWFRYYSSNPGSCADSGGTRVPGSGGTSLGSGSGDVAYSQNLTGLAADTTYYVCALASNPSGTGVGAVKSFTTAVASCANGAANPPACDRCPSGQAMQGGQCVEQTILSFKANPSRVPSGKPTSVTFTWSGTGLAGACSLSGTGVNLANVSSPQTASITITQPTPYTLTCGTGQKTATVNLLPTVIEI